MIPPSKLPLDLGDCRYTLRRRLDFWQRVVLPKPRLRDLLAHSYCTFRYPHCRLWYHAYDLYAYLGGYEDWMIAISAIWVFDRLARIGRIAIIGSRRSKVTELGGSYMSVDVPGIHWTAEPGKHVYAYFPTLTTLRPWENHPLIMTALLHPPSAAHSDSPITPLEDHNSDLEKHHAVNPGVEDLHHRRPTNGLTIYVKKAKGMTKSLGRNNSLLTLIEGPYPNNPTTDVLRCDRLLLIGGGIGITAFVPSSRLIGIQS